MDSAAQASSEAKHFKAQLPELTHDRREAPNGDIIDPHIGKLAILAAETPMQLDSGALFGPLVIAYQTYGTLNEDRSNVIWLCHALTGDQHVANDHPLTGKPGWWEDLVGPGKIMDTDRYFIVCSNVLGGCMGSTGPGEINAETGKPFGLKFPVITIGDMVRAQALLADHLGIDNIFLVIGGSMGGMQVLEWCHSYKDRLTAACCIASAPVHSAQNIAFHEIGRQAIMADPGWCRGNYYNLKGRPRSGLAVARMTAHVTYLSEVALHRKFGRRLQDRSKLTYGFDADFQVESYLRYQGSTFVERFDANSYLYITRAMDYFDLAADNGGILGNAFKGTKAKHFLVSFTSDWLFPTSQSRDVVHALNAVGADVSFVEVESDKGHDAFLLDEPVFHEALKGFISSAALAQGLPVKGG